MQVEGGGVGEMVGGDRERTLLIQGLLPPSFGGWREVPSERDMVSWLAGRWARLGGRPWPWRLRESTLARLRELDDPRWEELVLGKLLVEMAHAPGGPGLGLRLEATVPPGVLAVRLAEDLAGSGADSVYLRLREEGDITWAWPLRLAGGGEGGPLGHLPPESLSRELSRGQSAGNTAVRSHLFSFEGSLTEAADALSAGPRPCTEVAVVCGGLREGAEEQAGEDVERLRAATGAQGVLVVGGTRAAFSAGEVAEGLLRQLAVGLPLDAAAAQWGRDQGVPVILWATRLLISATSLDQQGRSVAARMRSLGETPLRLPPEVLETLAPAAPTRGGPLGRPPVYYSPTPRDDGGGDAGAWEPAEDVGAALERTLGRSGESRAPERGGLSGSRDPTRAWLVGELGKVAEREAARQEAGPGQRHLQAKVATPAGLAVEGAMPLRPGREYHACVVIGALRRGWLGLAEPVDEPEPRPDGAPLTLHVLFWEPTVCPQPRVEPLLLHPRGPTAVLRFPFVTAAEAEPFSARIAVYHRNRNLQTGLLRGTVGSGPAGLAFTLDAAPLPRFVGLEDRGAVGASIIFNDDPSGRIQAFTYCDGEAGVATVAETAPGVRVDPGSVDQLAKLVEALGQSLTKITARPEDYEGLEKEGTRKLLLALAQRGYGLLRRLRKDTKMADHLNEASSLQIVRAHGNAFFPAEYLYGGEPLEEEATVCGDPSRARDALLAGRCCGAYEENPEYVICPFKFWSLSKVIERHAQTGQRSGELDQGFELRQVPANQRQRVLDPLAGALLAASDRADKAKPETVVTLQRALGARVRRQPVELAKDWDEWAKAIARGRPRLLVLLPHHVRKDGFDLLEIGAEARRKSMQILRRHVRAEGDQGQPLVLLIGCETRSARIDLESFVPFFHDAGAAIVVSTIASILGRQAGPAVEVLVEEIQRIQGRDDATFGQALLAARRRLLANGTPMVLGLTSYGDADWRIAVAEEPGP